MMVIFTIALSMIFAWMRFRSGSLWPSTLAHAAFNAQAGFAIVFLSQADSLFRAPLGLIGLLPMIAFAIWLAITGRLTPDLPQATVTQPTAQRLASPSYNRIYITAKVDKAI